MQKKELTVEDEMLKARVVLKNLENLTYNIPKDDHAIALDLCQELQRVFDTFYQKLPQESGILIRPPTKDQVRKIRMKYKRQKFRQGSINCSSLPISRKRSYAKTKKHTSISQQVTKHS